VACFSFFFVCRHLASHNCPLLSCIHLLMAYRTASPVNFLTIPPPGIGDIVMLRLPFEVMLGLPSQISSSALSGATGSNYHMCVINTIIPTSCRMLLIKCWVCFTFSSHPNPINYVNSELGSEWSKFLLPLPGNPSGPIPPTPIDFGASLYVKDFVTSKPTWLLSKYCSFEVNPLTFKVGSFRR
jgi:hypothetical protein